MFRWIEQLEIKHAEMHRALAHFEFTSNAWMSCIQEERGAHDGHNARAVRQAAIYRGLADETQAALRRVGHPSLVNLGDSSLADRIEQFRNEQLSWMTNLVSAP
jgi:hypothetical protein